MYQKLPLLSVSFLALSMSQAQAQSLPGFAHEGSTIDLSFNFHNDNDDQPYGENFTTHLSASSRYAIGDSFGATITLAYANEEYEDEYFSERYLLDLNPYYSFGQGSVGVFYALIAHDVTGTYTDDAHYGLTADADFGAFGIETYAGIYEEDGDFAQDTYGFAASYDVTTDAMVFLSYQRDVFADDDFFEVASLGASYDLSGVTGGVPVTIGGEISRFGFDGERIPDTDWNQISVQVSYDFGQGAGSIFGPYRAVDYFYD